MNDCRLKMVDPRQWAEIEGRVAEMVSGVITAEERSESAPKSPPGPLGKEKTDGRQLKLPAVLPQLRMLPNC
jgi:hypothetical protein